ncbi:MAG: TonB-dependent receptor plug domain-containing protein, partial [Robiginitomaculum sp.]|nr:TonB-dependent receptor plug domain-containing protein [Robiginitomaculum sp.]
MRIQAKLIITILCVGASILSSTIAFAQDANGRYVLRIDGGTLGKVVDDVHEQTDIEFIYSFDLVNAGGINPVNGKYTLDEALAIMFEGTGLSGGLTESGMIVITRESGVQAPNLGEDQMISTNVKRSLLAGVSALVMGSMQTPALAQGASGVSGNSDANSQITQTGSVAGRVTYAGTDSPLIGAIVDLEGTSLSAVTNSRGEYRFAVAPTGTYAISVDYLGTETQTNAVTIRSNVKSVQNFVMGRVTDEIIVTSQRSSLMQALNQQRSADNNSTVVSSDLIGAFPAENISEALRRVPGVAFERDDATGEGTRISVRGFNAEAVNIKLNGLPLQGTGISRAIDLTGFLTENISQVTIHKTLLPSHESDSSGGLVEIETKSGLDYGDKYFSFGFEREGSLASGFGNELQASITAAYKFNDKFGVAGSLQYRDTTRDNYDVIISQNLIPVLPAGVTSSFRIPFDNTFPFDPSLDQPLFTGATYTKRQREETNLTGSLNFALDVSDNTSLRLDLQRIQATSQQIAQRSTLRFLTSSTDMPIPELGGEVRRRSYVRALSPNMGLTDNSNDLETT